MADFSCVSFVLLYRYNQCAPHVTPLSAQKVNREEVYNGIMDLVYIIPPHCGSASLEIVFAFRLANYCLPAGVIAE